MTIATVDNSDCRRSDQAVEYDPLRAAGVPVELAVAPGLAHGCLQARFISDAAGRAFGKICGAAGRLLSA